MLSELRQRFADCVLELHPDKTKIVYCKDGKRKKEYANQSFKFLGYTFRARSCKNRKDNTLFENFTAAVSKEALKSMRATIKGTKVRRCTELSLEEIAKRFNPILRGWLNYYGRYTRSAMNGVWRYFNMTLVAWARKKYRRFNRSRTQAGTFVERIAKKCPKLFVHWQIGVVGVFA